MAKRPVEEMRPMSAVALRALIKTSGDTSPRATEELTPLDIKRLTVHPKTPLPTEELDPVAFSKMVVAESQANVVTRKIPLVTEELSPLDLSRLAVPAPLRVTTASGEFTVRRCPRTAEPTWQIPRGFSPLDALRRVFGARR